MVAGLVRAAVPLLVSAAGLASGSAVVELTDETFDAFVAENSITMVEFYAPWCGHCKNLAPEYDSAADKLAEFDIKIANLDATAATTAAGKYDVKGYPTVKIFRDGEASDYEGERTADAIFHQMRHEKDPSYEIPKPAADAGWEGDKGMVVHLSDDDFDEYRQENPKMFTMFYAPWCGHCKNLKPDFAKASKDVAAALEDKDGSVVMTAMDCTVQTATCGKYDVNGYPTLMYFDGADAEPTKYDSGGRTAKAITSYLVKKVDPEWKPTVAPYEHKELWSEEDYGNGNVVHLDDDYFDWYRNEKTKMMFVMFYAPWCGHCKNLKPDWVAASEQGPKAVTMAAVDCTTSSEVCAKVGTEGYPTLRYFTPLVEGSKQGASSSEQGETYRPMARATDDLLWYTRDKADKAARAEAKSVTADTDFSKLKMKALKKLLKDRGEKCEGCTDKSEFVARVKEVFDKPAVEKPKRTGRTVMQEKRYQEAKAVADAGWASEDYGNGAVLHTVDGDFEEFQKANSPMLVMFYAPWCGHCKNLKPEWVKASEEMNDAKLAAVDCTGNPETCQKFGADSYPTLHWFKDADDTKGKPYDGGRSAKGIKKWVKTAIDPSYTEELEPFVNSELWKDESYGNGKIVHLDDDYFSSYRSDHPKMITMFYAPWCGHCKSFKPEFVAASEEAGDGVTLSAVDCTENSMVCGEFGVEGYPTIKVFEDSTGKGTDFKGSRDKAGVLAQVDQMSEMVIDKDDL